MSAAGRAAIAEGQRRRRAKQKSSSALPVTMDALGTAPERRSRKLKKAATENALSSRSDTVAAAAQGS
jgi:hypothetical protein